MNELNEVNIQSLRDYCLSLPLATEDMAFGDDCLLLRVCNKIFACISLVRNDYFVVKCDPEYAIELRERHSEIEPAWHWNKKYWIQINPCGTLTPAFIASLIRHSYSQVVAKLPQKVKREFPELLTVSQN